MFNKEAIKLAKPLVEAIKKISKGKWEWEPEVGEWCLINPSIIKDPQLIVKIDPDALNPIQTHQGYGFSYPDLYPKVLHFNTIIPLLHWERIEEILEGMGYIVKVRDNEGFGEDCKYNCGIYSDKLGTGTSAPTRQEAVMQAVIQRAKEKRK